MNTLLFRIREISYLLSWRRQLLRRLMHGIFCAVITLAHGSTYPVAYRSEGVTGRAGCAMNDFSGFLNDMHCSLFDVVRGFMHIGLCRLSKYQRKYSGE
jgi:hypothetical protein